MGHQFIFFESFLFMIRSTENLHILCRTENEKYFAPELSWIFALVCFSINYFFLFFWILINFKRMKIKTLHRGRTEKKTVFEFTYCFKQCYETRFSIIIFFCYWSHFLNNFERVRKYKQKKLKLWWKIQLQNFVWNNM